MRPRLDMKLWLYASAGAFVILSLASYGGRMIFPAAPASGPGVTAAETTMMSRILIYAGRLAFSLMFVYVYAKGYEQKSWLGEGLRYGLCVSVLVAMPNLVYTLVAPDAPASDTVGPLLRNVVQLMLAGPLAALIYRPQSARAAA